MNETHMGYKSANVPEVMPICNIWQGSMNIAHLRCGGNDREPKITIGSKVAIKILLLGPGVRAASRRL